MGFVESVCQPSTLRMLICPDASSAPNNIGAGAGGGGQTGLGCDPAFEFLVQTLERVGGAYASPLARRQAHEGEQAVSCLLQAVSNGAVLEPPFSDEGLAADFDLLRRRGIDRGAVLV